MRIGIDASALADQSADRGVGTYLKNLLRGLSARPEVSVAALAPKGAVLPDGVLRRPVHRFQHHRLDPMWSALMLPSEIRRLGADLFHSPAFNPPRSCPTPYVQTLHDLTPLVFRHPLTERDAARWLARRSAMQRAAAVFAVSQSSATQGVELLGLDPERMHVVHLGVDDSFVPRPPPPLAPDYLLAVSSWGPHKGFRELASIFDRVVDAGLPHRLRIVGFQDAWMRQHLEQDLASARHRDRIDLLGWVPDLVDQYAGAAALLVTSRAEGFGLPAAEAIACGVPVVAFDNTSLPEVVGSAGVLTPDGNVGAFADVVVDVLRDPALRERLAATARAHADRFRWGDSIAKNVAVYRSILSSHREG